jgi:ankyrin repeat protein
MEAFPPATFESAVDAVTSGDAATLESLLRDHPDLVRARSPREHRATLLHYVAANGVEDERQKSPGNAVQVAEILLRRGADVDALAETYGGGTSQTTLNLLVSSVHPARAGVQAALVETLVDFGAAVNGLEDDGSPLLTALAFHYAEAAETLVRRGARIDTIVTAAGLGRIDLVESFLNADGTLKPEVPLVTAAWLRRSGDARGNLQIAFVWAAMHGRLRMVELLLRKGIDPGVRDHRGWTALHWASHYGYTDVAELLVRWKAPVEAVNEFGGTPLGQTVWTSIHERFLPEHVKIIEMLIYAGAEVDPGWLRDDVRQRLDPRVAEALRRGRAE